MATKARHLKTPMQRWVFDHLSGAKDLAQDIADEAGVSVETVRGWQSRGRPSEHAIEVMERRFGEAASSAWSGSCSRSFGLNGQNEWRLRQGWWGHSKSLREQ